MRIYLNGLGELALFLKQNSKTVSNELFPKSLSSFIPLLESIKKGCRCHHKMKMKSMKCLQNKALQNSNFLAAFDLLQWKARLIELKD